MQDRLSFRIVADKYVCVCLDADNVSAKIHDHLKDHRKGNPDEILQKTLKAADWCRSATDGQVLTETDYTITAYLRKRPQVPTDKKKSCRHSQSR